MTELISAIPPVGNGAVATLYVSPSHLAADSQTHLWISTVRANSYLVEIKGIVLPDGMSLQPQGEDGA
jgi:hypothetical protein